jgi:signal transduction histidine kinase
MLTYIDIRGILLFSPYIIWLMKNVFIFFFFITFSCFIYSETKAAVTVSKAITISSNSNANSIQKEEVSLDGDSHSQKRFWTVITVACLLLLVIVLLMNNIRRTNISNAKLLELNNEITRQKDNLNQINHHLEEIINHRTKDLIAKNKQLSEYSYYLSHQIRGPIATLKGLMILEKENLIDQTECIDMMNKCVSEIDEKIIEMSAMLHKKDNA